MCDVCCETFNSSSRSRVTCPYCPFSVCSSCVEKYLLDTNDDPHCMSCRKAWSREILCLNLTLNFVSKKLKARRENLLSERERSLMPETQPFVEVEKQVRKYRVCITDTRTEAIKLRQKQAALNATPSAVFTVQANLTNQLDGRIERTRQIYEIEKQIKACDIDVAFYDQCAALYQRDGGAEVARKQFVRACPSTGCPGFLSTAWKCGLCENWACPDCHEGKGKQKDAPHTCNPDSVATARLLEKDSRPCPKCASVIFKIDGCFATDTPVLTWDGKTVLSQNVKKGDVLIGDDGAPRTVTDVCTGADMMYRVSQTTGQDYVVNSHHKLVLKFCGDGNISADNKLKWFDRENLTTHAKNFSSRAEAETFRASLKLPGPIEIMVEDFVKLPESTRKHLMGFKSTGINWPVRSVGLDPYLMGLWLGDGFSNGTDFASDDPEIQQYLYEWCAEHDAELVHTDAYRFRIRRRGSHWKAVAVGQGDCSGCVKHPAWICQQDISVSTGPLARSDEHPFKKWIDHYNLTNNKHIPGDYLLNDRPNRLALLAGLIDTDGHVANDGKRVSIIQSKEPIAKQIELLSRSLGFTTSLRVVERKNVQVPNTTERKDYGSHYIINISGEHLADVPTRIARKRCAESTPNKDWLRTSIKVVEIGRGAYYGWSVTGNHRFVGPDLTVLRNCDQMWCTQCHTAFSWRRGTIEAGGVHNPHYYDYMRARGNLPRAAGDVPCGGMPVLGVVMRLANNQTIAQIHRFYAHIQHVVLNRYVVDVVEDNRDLRIKFMIKDFTDEVFKKKLQQREKARQKKTEIRQILEMYQTVTIDLFQSFLQHKTVETLLQEFEQLKAHTNEELRKVSKRYTNCTVPLIRDDYSVY